MSTTVEFYDSSGPDTYGLTSRAKSVTINSGFGLQKRQRAEQGAGSTVAFLYGDGVEIAGKYDITILIEGEDVDDARFAVDWIEDSATNYCTSMLHTLPDGKTMYRAILGVESCVPEYIPGHPGNQRRVRLVMLTKFARWTLTPAENLAAYEAASKVIV